MKELKMGLFQVKIPHIFMLKTKGILTIVSIN